MDINLRFVATKSCNSRSIGQSTGEGRAFSLNFTTDQNSCFNNQHYNIDFSSRDDILVNRSDNYLIRSLVSPNTSGEHLPILACMPRLNRISYVISYGRGDDSVYNKYLQVLKTIMTVLCGFTNSPIAKTLKDISLLVFLFLGGPFCWSISRFKLALGGKRIQGIFVSIVVTQVIHIASSVFSSSCFLQEEGTYA